MGVATELRRKKLKKLTLAGPRLKRVIYVIRHKDKHVSPAMRAFLDILRDTLQTPEK